MDYSRFERLLLRLKHPHTSDMHWSSTSAWGMVEALDSVALQQTASLIKAANFFSISMDEATTVHNRGMLCIHGYVLNLNLNLARHSRCDVWHALVACMYPDFLAVRISVRLEFCKF